MQNKSKLLPERFLLLSRLHGDGNLNTLPSVGGLVTNGSNHWILHQPDQMSKTETIVAANRTLVPLAMVSVLLIWLAYYSVICYILNGVMPVAAAF